MEIIKRIMNAEIFIENLRKETGVPYIDVICYREHKEIFRYYSGAGVNGKETLQMYSCSKPVTVVAALRLIERGMLSLDDKVYKYLPEIENAYVVNEKNEKIAVGRQMTVFHLFTMTAGFTYDTATEPIKELVKKSGGRSVLRDFIAKFAETPLSFVPGSVYKYSLCHDVLAAVIEVVTGKKFSEYVKETIFEPLKMYNSRFDNGETNIADMYIASIDGKIVRHSGKNSLLPTDNYESGGAGLVSTVEDYIRFADSLACGGKSAGGYSVLSKKGLCELTTERIKSASIPNGFSDDNYGYGLGVRVRLKPTAWGLSAGEFGWDGAAGSFVLIDSVKKTSLFIGMHLLGWPNVFRGKHLAIAESVYRELFKE